MNSTTLTNLRQPAVPMRAMVLRRGRASSKHLLPLQGEGPLVHFCPLNGADVERRVVRPISGYQNNTRVTVNPRKLLVSETKIYAWYSMVQLYRLYQTLHSSPAPR